MSIDQEGILDFVAVDDSKNEVNLFVTDHFSWDESVNEHLFMLQEKINTYIAAIESGELVEKYPLAKGRKPVIKVIGKYRLPDSEIVKKFYEEAISTVREAGFDLRFEHFPVDSSSS